ncbi:MAG: hypothetical protein FWG34_09315 [Oscillospiraceae bacterium]|nr:hypothetical protein [Oscillospiraceae bacterium]
MNGITDEIVHVRRISPNDGRHYYYGYYDNPAFNEDGTKHLCNRTDFWDRLPDGDDTCELGIIDIASCEWRKFAETQAFNFQQGAMLQWNPKNPAEEVIYNIRDGDKYRTAVRNIGSGYERILPRAVANVSHDGKWGLCINMNRVYDFRPGYGYSGVRDEFFAIPQPKEDGIFVMDMETGTEKFILSYDEMGRLFNIDPSEKIVVNHITFSPDNRRMVFLVRTFPQKGKNWATGLGTINRDGYEFYLMKPMSMASHYNWLDGNHLLVWADVNGLPGMYVLTDQSAEAIRLNPDFFDKDIHCVYSPDKKYILGDGYPDKEGFRHIYLYNTETGKSGLLLRAKSDSSCTGDIRCDLHNRWSRDGRFVSFDSTHEGYRGLYIFEPDEIR